MTITVSYDGTKFSGGKFPEDGALLAGIKTHNTYELLYALRHASGFIPLEVSLNLDNKQLSAVSVTGQLVSIPCATLAESDISVATYHLISAVMPAGSKEPPQVVS